MKETLVVLFTSLSLGLIAQDTLKINSKLKSATVYYGYGAELTHEASFASKPGVKQILIQQLSTTVDINSIQINLPASATLLSSQYSIFSPTHTPIVTTASKIIKDSIELINKSLRQNSNLIGIEEQTLEKTGKIIETIVSTSGNKTVSAADALALIGAYNAKIEKAKTAIFNLKEIELVMLAHMQDLQNKLQAASSLPVKNPKPFGQLLLQVMCNSSTEIPVTLSYFTRNAGWTPLYDVKVNAKTNEVKLVYKASVTQTTGVDWKQSRLTLSTGNPSLGGVPPELSTRFLKLYVPAIYSDVNSAIIEKDEAPLAGQNSLSEVVIDADGTTRQKLRPGYQTMDVDPTTLQNHIRLSESQLNTNFEIDLPYDIESDGQLHAVNIREEKINARLKNYALPVIDNDAYLLAAISDWQNLNLLPGTANIIMDNTYLGKSFIDANSTADTLNLSLGRDRRVAIRRTAMKEFTSTKYSGNNVLKTYTYEITIKNNKLTDVDLDLKDQYPVSATSDIEIKLTEAGNAVVAKETGFLNWNVQLNPGESKKIRFTYTVKYGKDKLVANL